MGRPINAETEKPTAGAVLTSSLSDKDFDAAYDRGFKFGVIVGISLGFGLGSMIFTLGMLALALT